MKKRIGIIIVMLGLSMLAGLPLVQGQQPGQTPTRPVQPRAPQPSVPALPNVPPQPSVPAVPPLPPMDPLGDVMFPPDLIMRHARELELTDEQKTFMRGEIQKATTRFNELQWQLQDAMEVFHQTLESNSVNEAQALSQLDKVLDVEREIKRLHIGMGIRLKNQLTPEQQAKLQNIRMAMRLAERG
jgi:Spy/CpxP family protein refolding chaperone